MRDLVFEASLAGLYVVDIVEKRHLSINRAYTDITGYAQHDLDAMPPERFIELFHEDDREHVLRHLESLVETAIGEPVDLAYRFRAADGRWLHCVSRHVPAYRSPDGVLRHVIGSVLEAPGPSERPLAEDREAAAQLDALFSAAPVGLGFWDTELRFKRVNSKLAEINGLPIAAHIGRTPNELLPKIHGIDAIMERWRQILATGLAEHGVEVTGTTHAGPGLRIWQEHFFPVSTHGTVIGLGAVVEDVTDQRHAQDALRESESSLRAFIAHSPIMTGIVELSVDDSDILHLTDSTATERYFQVEHGGTIGRWAKGELGASRATVDAWAAQYREAQRRRIPVRFSYETTDAANARQILDVFVAHIGPGSDGRERFCYSAVDDTERHQMEQALRASDRHKSDFLAILGHELRNPLAPLSSGLELLRRTEHDPALGSRALDMMQRQVHLLVRLADDLLDVASIGRGKIALSLRPFDLRQALHSALEQTAARADARRQVVRIREPRSAVVVHGDFARLTQVFTNLLTNAIRYTDPEGVIDVGLEHDRDTAIATVTDTGRGIAAENLEAVFQLFTRLPETERAESPGLGVGLALVRRLVELHGGNVVARSAGVGRGSSFVVRLPLAPARAAQ